MAALNRIAEHHHILGVENSGFRSAAGATLHCMGAVVIQMPPTGAETWWSTEPQLHSWEPPPAPPLHAVERRHELVPQLRLEVTRVLR